MQVTPTRRLKQKNNTENIEITAEDRRYMYIMTVMRIEERGLE